MKRAHVPEAQESKEPLQKGAGSNHVISSVSYHKFLSSYWHCLAEQGCTPAEYLQLPPKDSPLGSSYFFCIESMPRGRSCSQD